MPINKVQHLKTLKKCLSKFPQNKAFLEGTDIFMKLKHSYKKEKELNRIMMPM